MIPILYNNYQQLNRLEILTEKTYNKQNFIDMEIYILSTLDYDLGTPTPVPFLNRFLMAHDHSAKVNILLCLFFSFIDRECYFIHIGCC